MPVPSFLEKLSGDLEGLSTGMDESPSIYVPPLNFATVSPDIYRSGFPRPQNYEFLDSLGLRSILYLADQDMKSDTRKWAESRNLLIEHLRIESNKEPLVEASMPDMRQALLFVHEPAHQPILVFCNRGRHRVGLLSALIRRTEGWSLTMLLDEYKRFFGSDGNVGDGGNKAGRVGDFEWVETFELSGVPKTGLMLQSSAQMTHGERM